MPNCFSLTRKSDLVAGPVSLKKIDEEICNHMQLAVHPKWWCCNWYDWIGFKLAMGGSWETIRTDFNKYKSEAKDVEEGNDYADLLKILDFLEANYTYDAWAEIGRR